MSSGIGTPTRATRTLFLVGCIVLAEPLASTILFPFIFFMVKDFGIEDEKLIGSRAGLISIHSISSSVHQSLIQISVLASAFFMGQMITTSSWGYISDKYGRKPVLLIGLLGSATSMVFFGLSKSLAWAVISRGVCGLLNGRSTILAH